MRTTLTKVVAGSAGTASAADASADLRRSFAAVSGWVSKAADLAPADKYAYRPVDSVRTFGQIANLLVFAVALLLIAIYLLVWEIALRLIARSED